MSNALNIPELRSLAPEEESSMQEFMSHMERVVIPQIVEQDFENRKRAVESRNWTID